MAFDIKKELLLIEKSINPHTLENIAKVAYWKAEHNHAAFAKLGMSFQGILEMCRFNLAHMSKSEFIESVQCFREEISTSSFIRRINTGGDVLPLSSAKAKRIRR